MLSIIVRLFGVLLAAAGIAVVPVAFFYLGPYAPAEYWFAVLLILLGVIVWACSRFLYGMAMRYQDIVRRM